MPRYTETQIMELIHSINLMLLKHKSPLHLDTVLRDGKRWIMLENNGNYIKKWLISGNNTQIGRFLYAVKKILKPITKK